MLMLGPSLLPPRAGWAQWPDSQTDMHAPCQLGLAAPSDRLVSGARSEQTVCWSMGDMSASVDGPLP